MTWQEHLWELVGTGRYRTQSELVSALEERGYAVHQGSVSRELRRLGVVKVRGVYVRADATLGAPVHRFDITAGGCLCVLHTDPAFASVLGQAVDDAAIPGILGTIAGDDTVFVATSGVDATRALAARFDVPVEIP